MKTSDNLNDLIPDLIKFQAEMPILKKANTVSMELKSGRKIEYDYIELGSIVEQSKEILAKNGLSIIQPRGTIDGKPALFTMLLHKSGQYIQTYTMLDLQNKTEQEKGSVITYNSRYDYVGMARFGLVGEDDDGASASGSKSSEKPKNDIKRQEQLKSLDSGVKFMKKNFNDYIKHLSDTTTPKRQIKALADLNDVELTKAVVAMNQWVDKEKLKQKLDKELGLKNENITANQ